MRSIQKFLKRVLKIFYEGFSMGIKDIEIKYLAEQQARATIGSVLRIINLVEEKGLELSDEEIAKIAKVSKEEISIIRKAFSKREITSANSSFIAAIVNNLKAELKETIKTELVSGANRNIITTEELKKDENRPVLTPSIADVFNTSSFESINIRESNSVVGTDVSEQIEKLRQLKKG